MENHILYQGKKIHYAYVNQSKKDLVCVCLHGYLEDLSIWVDFFDQYPFSYNRLYIDLPGHGKSETLGEIHRMEDMATVVNHLMKHLGIEKALFIGHSMGGYIALAFLEAFKNKVLGLCLFHSTAAADSLEKKQIRLRTIEIINSNFKEFISHSIVNLFAPENLKKLEKPINKLKEIALRTKPEGAVAATYGMMERPDRTYLIKSSIPKLYIVGQQDKALDLKQVKHQTKEGKNTSYIWITSAAHMGFIEAPEVCLSEIQKFISSIIKNKNI